MTWHTNVISEIRRVRIKHKHFDICLADCVARLNACNPGEIIYIYGPTRVGKTELLKAAMRAVYGKLDPASDSMAYALVTASNASRAGQFSTLGLTRRALRAVQHPIYSNPKMAAKHSPIHFSLSRKTEDAMRDDFVEMLLHRQVQCMGFDEMQNTRFVPGGNERAAWFVDSLKCAAADGEAIFMIAGTYELLEVLDRCPQVIGRSDAIHFPRYKGDRDEDIAAWAEILSAYSALIPFRRPSTSLQDWDEMLFKGSYGCIGLLDKWLRSAVSVASHSGSKYLTEGFLKQTYRQDRELTVISNSVEQGELLLDEPTGRSTLSPPTNESGNKARTKGARRPFEKEVKRYTGDERLRERT
jgi:hypothetical protein